MRYLPDNPDEFIEPERFVKMSQHKQSFQTSVINSSPIPSSSGVFSRMDGEKEKGYVNIKDYDSVYVINIFNFIGIPTPIVLFGANQFLLTPFFGNPPPAVVSINTSGVASYLEILKETQETPFIVKEVNVETSLPAPSNLIVSVNYRDGNGVRCTRPFKPSSYFSIDQFQNNFIEADKLDFLIDKYFSLTFLAPPDSTIITFFVKEKIKPQNKLKNMPITDIHRGTIQIPQRKIYLKVQ